MNMTECIKSRRSIRKYGAERIDHSVLESIISTASFSPSWKNTQITRYIAIEDTSIIQEIADKGACVIVSRAADYVLKDRKNVFKVFLHAPKEFRIANIMETYGDNAQQAEENIRHSDAARASYYRNVTSQDWGDPHFMDLCLDASLGKEVCAQIIVDAVNALNNK